MSESKPFDDASSMTKALSKLGASHDGDVPLRVESLMVTAPD
jgi:hypothetical protein